MQHKYIIYLYLKNVETEINNEMVLESGDNYLT